MYTLVIVVFTTQFGAGTIERASAMNISSVPGFQTLALCESAASNVGFASLKVNQPPYAFKLRNKVHLDYKRQSSLVRRKP
jgi:hypothetical protein